MTNPTRMCNKFNFFRRNDDDVILNSCQSTGGPAAYFFVSEYYKFLFTKTKIDN